MNKRRIVTAFALVILLAGFAIRGAEPPDNSDFLLLPDLTGVHGGNLVVPVSADPNTFNRMMTAGIANTIIANRLSADLVHINRETFELEPSLALRWELDESGKSYTIYLRRGIRFSDGTPFTADDVVFTFQVMADPKAGIMQASQIHINGEFPAVEKLDEHTLRITFPRPLGMGLRVLDSIPILPKKHLIKAYKDGTFSSAWGATVAPGDVVGLGPFRLKEYQRGVKVVVERNPHYWKKDRDGKQLPYLESITFLIIHDRNAQALRFQAGELDLVYALNAENYASLRPFQARGKFTLNDMGPGLGMDFLWFNLKPGADSAGKPYVDPEKLAVFQRAEFRRAVSHALDRRGMGRSVFLGLGASQHGPITSGNQIWYDKKIEQSPQNLDLAQELLSRIGLRDSNGDGVVEFGAGKRPLEIHLFTARGNAAREKMAQIIRDNLSKIGIRTNIQLFLPNELASRFLQSFDYEAILFGMTPTDVSPDLQTDLWLSSGNLHLWNPGQREPSTPWEAEIDTLSSRLVRTTDESDRKQIFDRIQQIWIEQMPAIPTIAPHILSGWKNNIGNLKPAILVPYLLWNAEEITKLTS